MQFKAKPGDNPKLKYEDSGGDKLHAFLPHIGTPTFDGAYELIIYTEGRVGLTRKKAVQFAKAILMEFGEA